MEGLNQLNDSVEQRLLNAKVMVPSSLKFVDFKMEKSFCLALKKKEIHFLRYFLVLLFAVNLFFAVKDILINPDRAMISIHVQLYLVLPFYMLSWILLTYGNLSYNRYYALTFFIFLFTFTTQLAMIMLNGYGEEKVVGIMPLIIFGIYGFSGVRYFHALQMSPILVAMLAAFFFQDHGFDRSFVIFAILILSISFVGIGLLKYRTEYLQRQSFHKNNLLKQNESDLIAKNRQVMQMNALKQSFIALLVHDVRSPLNNINMTLNLVNQQSLYEDVSTAILSKLGKQVNGVTAMISDILMWVKSQSGDTKLESTDLDLKDAIEELEIFFTEQLAEKNLTLNLNLNVVHLPCYSEIVKAVLRNLLNNAIKFSKEGGKITVSSTIKNNGIYLEVKDSGLGMPEQQVNKIGRVIEPASGTFNEKGVGLGLRICQELLHVHESCLLVQSELGKGSAFGFLINCQKAENSVQHVDIRETFLPLLL
ncbi:MAG: HAMP domain-containing sensor histidine kinase [Reichenbachiella sp.]|uniref:sensor histidine kinase n=1 Tax=Reichenbachiella sp. TaxID=2184521 RepID=UPI003265658B